MTAFCAGKDTRASVDAVHCGNKGHDTLIELKSVQKTRGKDLEIFVKEVVLKSHPTGYSVKNKFDETEKTLLEIWGTLPGLSPFKDQKRYLVLNVDSFQFLALTSTLDSCRSQLGFSGHFEILNCDRLDEILTKT